MIPIQTFLALILALTLMSCSQEPPPGMRQKGTEGSKALKDNSVSSTPSPTSAPSSSPSLSPSSSPTSSSSEDPSLSDLEGLAIKRPGNTHWRWDEDQSAQRLTWTFVGLDAERLFLYTQVAAQKEQRKWAETESEIWVKRTPQYQCEKVIRSKFREFYSCQLHFHAETFAVVAAAGVAVGETDSDPLRVEEELQGEFIQFFKNADLKNPFFRVQFLGKKAQELYSRIPRAEGPSKFKTGGLRRFGEHLTCENVAEATSKESGSSYYCLLFGNLKAGVFDTIQP